MAVGTEASPVASIPPSTQGSQATAASTNPTKPNNNHSKKRKSKSSFRIFLEIVLIGAVLEFMVHRALSQREFKELEEIRKERMEAFVDAEKREALEAKRLRFIEEIERQDQARSKNQTEDPTTNAERLKTRAKLEHMGVDLEGVRTKDLPLWSQIVENFNSHTKDDEPVVLGLEHCEDFRNSKDPRTIAVGGAGMFSTGTNLLFALMAQNCEGPRHRVGSRAKFALVQVPWGKHNPADARFHHQVKHPQVPDREAVLPVVAIRHPYTWMSAMCRHSYKTRWRHVQNQCHQTLNLKERIKEVPYGFKKYNATHNVTNSYPSLAHMYMEWYRPWFLDERHNQTPRIMVRHEDLVYRSEKVVSKICECVGGKNLNKNKDWEDPGGFQYEEETANRGKGHGAVGRSGLLDAVIKYGQPLRNWYDEYTGSDRKIMKAVFQGEADPEMARIFEVFQYPLFRGVGNPTAQDKMRTNQRLFLQERDKELREKAKKQQ